jgi:hypothetical protein
MSPRYSASQFKFGERVRVQGPSTLSGQPAPVLFGTVQGWDQSNTHCAVQLDGGEQLYFRIADLEPVENQ